MKTNYWKIFIAVIGLITFLSVAIVMISTNDRKVPKEKTSIRVGVTLYRFDDTFILNLRREIEAYAKSYEQNTGIKVDMEIVDAKESQITQNNQVDRFISLGYDVICVNPVDRSDSSNIIDKAMASDTPIVFFNRQPVDEDMKRWNRLYYVGVDPKESAILEGEMFVDQYKKDPSLFDLDGDKSISYVLLEGEYSHQDSLIRTEWSVKTLKDGGVPIKKLTGAVANWERNQASALMEQWLKSYPNKIELVLSNNDDMALGAIDAIDRVGDTSGIKVIGIDGTPQAIEAINEGKMLGSVEFNKEEYAKAIFDIAATEALGGDVDSVIKLEDGKYYNAQQKIVIKNQ